MSRFRAAALSILLGAAFAAPSAHAQVTLHLFGYAGEPVDAVIDWGSQAANGSCLRVVQGAGRSVSCPEARPGDRIRISGTVPQFGPGVSSDIGNTVSRVVSWGDVGLRSLDGAFRGNPSLTSVPSDLPVSVENMNATFKDATNFSQDLSSWGMSVRNVTVMTDLFDGAKSQLTNMSRWCMKNFNEEPPGLLGRTLNRAPILRNLSNWRPRIGECGLTLPGTISQVAEANTFFLHDLSAGIEIWPNAPSQTSIGQLVFDVIDGELPPGLTLNRNTGEISGVPTVPGEYEFQIRARQY